MPEAPHFSYIFDYLAEVGLVSHSSMSPSPISFQEILAWQSLTGIGLSSFEASTMRTISTAYVNQLCEKEYYSLSPLYEQALEDSGNKLYNKAIKEATRLAKDRLRNS